MLTYNTLARKPGAFTSMTGLTVQEFEDLVGDRRPRYDAARQERGAQTPRRRAPGGGSKPCYALRERLLMTLIWLRLYLTCDAVGVPFAVDKSTVSRYTRPLLRLLRDQGQETLGWPEEARASVDGVDGVDGAWSDPETTRRSRPTTRARRRRTRAKRSASSTNADGCAMSAPRRQG